MKVALSLMVSAFFCASLVWTATEANAQANTGIVICRKVSSGQLVLRDLQCQSGESKISRYSQLKGTNGKDASAPTVAAGKVDADCDFESKILGSSITSVSCTKKGAGEFQITIRGTFANFSTNNTPLSRSKVVVQALPISAGFSVSKTEVTSATRGRIIATISTTKSESASIQDDGVTFSILTSNAS